MFFIGGLAISGLLKHTGFLVINRVLQMTPQRAERIEKRLHDLGIIYHPAAEIFESNDGLVEVEAIMAAMPDCSINDLAAFVERKRMAHYHVSPSAPLHKPRRASEAYSQASA